MKWKLLELIFYLILLAGVTLQATPAMAASSVTTTTLNGTINLTIAVTPASPNLAVGYTQQFTAIGTYLDRSTADITSQVTWDSSAIAVAAISSGGLATGVATGSTSITASLSGATSPAVTLTVTATAPGGGGVGGGPAVVFAGSSINLKINMEGNVTQGNVNLDSQSLEKEMSSTSKTGDISLNVYPDTLALNVDGSRIKVITIRLVSEPPKPPEGNVTVGRVFDLGPNGATFSVPIQLTITYDPAELPKGAIETELYIAHYNATDSEENWVPDPCVVDTEAKTITTDIGHFSIYAIMAKSPAEQQIAIPIPTPSPESLPPAGQTPTPSPTVSSPFSISIYWWLLLFASAVIGLLIYTVVKKSLRILVVVGDPAMEQLFTKSLKGLRHKVTTAANGVEAVKLVTSKRFDLIFLDFQMPDIDGSELFVRLRELDKYVTMAIITNEIDTSRLKIAMQQGPILLMHIPVNRDDVIEALRRFQRGMVARA